MAAQACLPTTRCATPLPPTTTLSSIWGTLSPDPLLIEYETRPAGCRRSISRCSRRAAPGAVLALAGAKTIELIHQNVHVEAVRDDLDDILLDAELVEALLDTPDPGKKAKEIEFKVAQRLRRHMGNPASVPLRAAGVLKERHEQGQLHSIEFLKQLLDLAHDLLVAEQDTRRGTRTAARRR